MTVEPADALAVSGSTPARSPVAGSPQDEEIPLEAKILAVADAYEAMTSDRVYRRAIGEAAAREELRAGAGTQFDPRVTMAVRRALARESERPRALAADWAA